MAIERVIEHFEKFRMRDKILEFDVSSATVLLAAEAVGCQPQRIAKTLSYMVDGKPILVVMAGDARTENKKFKAQFSAKAKMLTADELVELVGHAIGGVCPFGINEGVTVYLDESLKRFDTVFPACGSSNSAIELTIEQLEQTSYFTAWVDISKIPE